MPLQLIDIGLNLTDKSFRHDCDEVIERALEAGVSHFILTGTNLQCSLDVLDLARQKSHFSCTAGCHPHHAKDFNDTDLARLKELIATESKIVAVGECGLDFNRNFSPPESQIEVFEQHLALAALSQKPLFMHERDAADTFASLIKQHRNNFSRGVVHCFTADKDALESYLDLDLYIGITGWLCDERRGATLKSIVKYIPADRLMLETDAPYLLPRDLKPKPKSRRNEPIYLPHIARAVAEARDEDFDQLAKQSFENTRSFFGLNI